MIGTVGILNVGEGDTKLTFDPTDPAEVERSGRIVRDMIRRGFVLLVEIGRDEKGPVYRRAKDFDPETAEYIIAGTADATTTENPENEQEPSLPKTRRGKGTKGRRTTRIAAASTNAISVARTAGG